MTPSRGSVIVAIGEPALREAKQAKASLLRLGFTDAQVRIVDDGLVDGDRVARSRWLKLNVLDRAPWDHVLYMDADCRAQTPGLEVGFTALRDGVDLVLVPSYNQGPNSFWHCLPEDREAAWAEAPKVPQFGCGVMFIARNPRTLALFEVWREEWARFKSLDQAAFVRALVRAPVRLLLLGPQWNGGGKDGVVIAHHWGACAQ
jgi:hypothetical protein